ncbi:Spo0B domain-containing protein [Alkalicoccobacillus gibsonii]|uniref:Spo0B domain-containing protein n=1 Tax=Alkalicoccobacillus gibsonii TaxID=79881 RepID=UPI003516994F
MTRHEDLLSTLRHTRHDWLNILQLIKGNLALGHYHRIEEIIEQTTLKSISESKLCTIGVPELSLFLIGYNWGSQKVDLNYEINGEQWTLEAWGEPLLLVTRSIMKQFDQSSSFTSENSVMITFDYSEQDCLLTFRFIGETELKEADWKDLLKVANDSSLMCALLHQDEYECVITILIKKV